MNQKTIIEQELWINLDFLVENDMRYIKWLLKWLNSMIVRIIEAWDEEYEDIVWYAYIEILKYLKNYDKNKADIKTYIIWTFNKRFITFLKWKVYNKKWIVYYNKSQLDRTRIKELDNDKSVNHEIPIIIEPESCEDVNDWYSKFVYWIGMYEEQPTIQELEEDKCKDDMSIFIGNLSVKYGEHTMQEFADYFYGRKQFKGKKKNSLFLEIEKEIFDNFKDKYGQQ